MKYYCRLGKGGGENKPESNNFQKNMVDAGSTIFEDKDALTNQKRSKIISGFLIQANHFI